MRLFAIRLENADTVVVAAADEPQALQKAGLTSETLSYVHEQLEKQGVTLHRADLVLDGVGPQRYEIREINDLFLRLRISELGIFTLEETDEPTYDALYEGYPIMRTNDEEIGDRWPNAADIEIHRAEHNALMADAFSREKTRLMIPTEADEQT